MTDDNMLGTWQKPIVVVDTNDDDTPNNNDKEHRKYHKTNMMDEQQQQPSWEPFEDMNAFTMDMNSEGNVDIVMRTSNDMGGGGGHHNEDEDEENIPADYVARTEPPAAAESTTTTMSKLVSKRKVLWVTVFAVAILAAIVGVSVHYTGGNERKSNSFKSSSSNSGVAGSPTTSPTTTSPVTTNSPSSGSQTTPTANPSSAPIAGAPTVPPTSDPTTTPTDSPTVRTTTANPTSAPIAGPPTVPPTSGPTTTPTDNPTVRTTTVNPTSAPTTNPTSPPVTDPPTDTPTVQTTPSVPTVGGQPSSLVISETGIMTYTVTTTENLVSGTSNRQMRGSGTVSYEYNDSTGFSSSIYDDRGEGPILWNPNTINSQLDDVYYYNDDPKALCIERSTFNDDLTQVVTVGTIFMTDRGPELLSAITNKRQELVNSPQYQLESEIVDTSGSQRGYKKTRNVNSGIETSTSWQNGDSWYVSNASGFFSSEITIEFNDGMNFDSTAYRVFHQDGDTSTVVFEYDYYDPNDSNKFITEGVIFETDHAVQLLQYMQTKFY